MTWHGVSTPTIICSHFTQQKVRELRKAQETVLMLQEQLEETTPPAVPEGCSVEDQLKLRETLRQREKNIQVAVCAVYKVCTSVAYKLSH